MCILVVEKLVKKFWKIYINFQYIGKVRIRFFLCECVSKFSFQLDYEMFFRMIDWTKDTLSKVITEKIVFYVYVFEIKCTFNFC